MQKALTITGLFCTLLLSYFSFQYKLPATEPLPIPQIKTEGQLLLFPLDSRPVCTELPERLAILAGTKIIVPPKALLDNYENKAHRPELLDYFQKILPEADEAFLSTDLLIHGGLLASRQLTENKEYEQKLFNALHKAPTKNITLFSIVPRLLVSDQLIPDRWYKYYLFRYSQYADIYDTTGDRFAINYVGEYARKIPIEILSKYLELYRRNQALGLKIIEQATPHLTGLIGQDDSNPYGLPQGVIRHLQQAVKKCQKPISFTEGADEIASLLVAKSYLSKHGYKPKIAICYADPTIKDLTMPYQSKTCQELIQDKCQLLGLEVISNIDKADLILYINCGHDKYQPQKKQAQKLIKLLAQYPNVALVDLSANFEKQELLMPLLIDNRAPLNRLTAYGGWNTFSNSLGTALAQGAIMTCRKQELKDEQQLLALYAANLNFNTERILEDFYYQKLLHSQLSWEINTLGYDANHMHKDILNYAQQRTNSFLRIYSQELLHYCLGRQSFYKNYYLSDITVQSSFPWQRTFETKLKVETKIGYKK